MGTMIRDVHQKTTGTNFADEYVPPPKEPGVEDMPEDEANPDDIPF